MVHCVQLKFDLMTMTMLKIQPLLLTTPKLKLKLNTWLNNTDAYKLSCLFFPLFHRELGTKQVSSDGS